MYGSDYLLGLSTFAPDVFAVRDRFWVEGDSRFYEFNDLLQYFGFLAFRRPSLLISTPPRYFSNFAAGSTPIGRTRKAFGDRRATEKC